LVVAPREMTKRALDVVGALVIGLVTAPIWATAAVAIRISDGAPVLHRAVRVGRGGAPFTQYKFRTMVSAAGPSITALGDRRITPLGAFLRRTKIDELPELWNVLRGDMSLVGPRPEDPAYVERYTGEQRRLLSVAPGLTSPGTLAYQYEASILARYPDPERAYVDKVLPDKLAMDLAWLDRRSTLGDARVLATTARALVGGSSTTPLRRDDRPSARVRRKTAVDQARAVVLGRAVLPSADFALGQRMMARFRYLEAAQWWPRERVLAARDEMLAEVVRIAATDVELYRDLYADAGVHPANIRGAADLASLPIVTKPMLRDGYPWRTTRRTKQRTYDECSAGSTGEPLCVKEDAATAGWYRATFLQILTWAGWSIGDRHLQLGINPERQRGRALKDRLLRCSYVSVYGLDEAELDRALGQLVSRRICYVFGYPGAVHELARRSAARGAAVHLDGVVTWGDLLDARQRSTIEDVFGCRVRDAYGLAEGVWIASQCPSSDLYHVHSLDTVVEVLDDAGQEVELGTSGHVVVTRLHAGPSPLIRYRTGDLAVRSAAACACRRGYETLDSIVGRSADTLVTPSGKRLLVHFFNGVFGHYLDIGAFQVAKVSAACLELRVVPGDGAGVPSMGEAVRRIAEHVPDMQIDTRIVERIPLTRAGKRRLVVDETTLS
jgi:lipopolysaccharide/colanic/teichoic acid biosynthesis glycosyltransferase/phenylacetate-coenzyme A ligase PaaK-like adenylate-forming protein